MRKLVIHMHTTLDGRISRPDTSFWEPFCWGEEEMAYLNQTFAAADTWAMSRKLYEFVVPYWEQVAAGMAPDEGEPVGPASEEFAQILADLTKLVFSRTLHDDPARRRIVRSGDLAAVLRQFKEQEGGDIIASFGPRTLGPLVGEPGLINGYLLVVHPAVLADGPRIFEQVSCDFSLRLEECRVFDAGAVVLRYSTLSIA